MRATKPKVVDVSAEMAKQLGIMVKSHARNVVAREERDALMHHQARAYLDLVFERDFLEVQRIPYTEIFLLPVTEVSPPTETSAFREGKFTFDLGFAEQTRARWKRADGAWHDMIVDVAIPAVYLLVPKDVVPYRQTADTPLHNPHRGYVREPMATTFQYPIGAGIPLLRFMGLGYWIFWEDAAKKRHYLWQFALLPDALKVMVKLQGFAGLSMPDGWVAPEGGMELPYELRMDLAFLKL